MVDVKGVQEQLNAVARSCVALDSSQPELIPSLVQSLESLLDVEWPPVVSSKLRFACEAARACSSQEQFEGAFEDLGRSIDEIQVMVDRISRDLTPVIDPRDLVEVAAEEETAASVDEDLDRESVDEDPERDEESSTSNVEIDADPNEDGTVEDPEAPMSLSESSASEIDQGAASDVGKLSDDKGASLEVDNESGTEQETSVETSMSAQPEEVKETAPDVAASFPSLMDWSDDPLIDEFVAESLEHFQDAEAALMEIDSAAGDKEAINAVFRAFHTVKGVAGLLDLTVIGGLAHRAESLLDAARKDRVVLEGMSLELCFKALDLLKSLLESLASAGEPAPLPGAYPPLMVALEKAENGQDLAEAMGGGEASAKAPESASQSEEDSSVDETPTPDEPCIESDEAIVIAPEAEAEAEPEVQTAPPEPDEKTKESPPEENAAPSRASSPAAPSKSAPKSAPQSTVKVATERLDSLVDLVGELVIATAMIRQDKNGRAEPNPEAEQRAVSHLCKVTDELQAMAMSMRMVPLKATFQRAARLVRDLGGKFGKKIEFEIGGEDTELDRNMVEKIGDPLVHMLRNSVDHGIETSDVRRAKGKNPAGKIQLRAFHQAGNVVIQLSDDGGGLNRKKILNKAIENGIADAVSVKEMSDQEIYQLIFQPGFSTAEKVTDVSGRGVGMDVVKKNIEALRGSAEIDSVEGEGTVFTMRLPLTLAIIDGMVVSVGDRRYILPTLSIQNFLRPNSDQRFVVEGKGEAINVRGNIMPIYRLHTVFDIETPIVSPEDGLLVILEVEGGVCALLVDDLIGQQQVVIKTLGSSTQLSGVSGAAILGDGTVGLILDPAGVIRIAKEIGSCAPMAMF